MNDKLEGLISEALTQNKCDERFHEDHLRLIIKNAYDAGYNQAIRDEYDSRRG